MLRDEIIAGIRLGKIIGAGATGVVHAGTVVATGQQVAVKLVRPQPGQPAKLVERTVQEGRVGWAVRHPNVVRVYEWGMAGGGAAYIVMERLEGETLAETLLTRGRLPADEVVDVARQVARGLAAIHAEGGVHRDVKPENVFVCTVPADKIKLLDLGIVHLGADHPARLVRTGVGLVVGTLGYLAPEQARGGTIDARSDLYGLGATLYHALVGQPPHPDGDVVEVLRHIALMTAAPPLPEDVPAPLARLIRWMLAPEPDDRPPDAAAVLDALEAVGPSPTEDDTGRMAPVEDPFLAMDEIADHAQIRAGIIAGVARAMRENHGPPELSDDLHGLDRLKERRRTAAARARELRRETTGLAEVLDGRKKALERTMEQLEAAQNEVRERYLQSTAALMEIADSIEGIDRRYLRHYEQLDHLLGDDAAVDTDPPGGAPSSVPHCLAEMEALHQSRAFFADSQAQVRARLRTQHRAVSGINLQVIEIKRELLAVEAERQATLVGLEDALRTAEDEVLKLDREIEHQFLRLGFIVQAHQARRRMQPAAGMLRPALDPADSAETLPMEPVRRRLRVVGKLPSRREGGAPADRRSVDAGPPADRRSVNGAAPADRRSVGQGAPADRRSVNAAAPADRRSVGQGAPADRRSVNGAAPADRRSVGQGAPADRRSVNAAAPADRRSVGSIAPADRRSVNAAAPADRRSLGGAAPPADKTDELDTLPRHAPAEADADTNPRHRPDADPDADTNPRHRPDADPDADTNPRHRPAADPDATTDPRPRPAADVRAPRRAPADDTAPQDPPRLPPEDDELDAVTSPDRLPPTRRGDTMELVSPGTDPPLPPGAALRDRVSRPPPLPPEVWTSAREGEPDGDRRAAPRVPCAVRVEVQSAEERALLTTRDLGVDGAFVFSPRGRPPGSTVELVLHLGRERVELAGEVVHGQAGVGFGVRFVGFAAQSRARLEGFLADAARRARSG